MRTTTCFLLTSLLVAAGSAHADAPRSRAVDVYKSERRARIMTGVGFCLFGTAYLPTAGFGLSQLASGGTDSNHFGPLMVTPVFGPLVLGAQLARQTDGWFPELAQIMGAILIFDSVVQLTGVVVGIVGAVNLPRAARVRDTVTKISFAPLLSPTMAGLGVSGRF